MEQPPRHRERHEKLLGNLYPGDIFEHPGNALQAILRTVVMRANFIPAVRYRIGWRGVHACVSDGEAWTAKIADWPGVFGITWLAEKSDSQRIGGWFQLLYFPDPQEELVERFSLQAAARTQRDDYLPSVRQFPHHAELSTLFHIGNLEMTIERTDLTLGLNLQAESLLASRAEDGVNVTLRGETITLVPPGGWDQHLPALSIAKAAYEVLGGSTAFCLGTPPSAFCHCRKPGHIICYRSDGEQERQTDEACWTNECRVEFMTDPSPGEMACAFVNGDIVSEWRPGQPLPDKWQTAPWWQAHQIGDTRSLDKQLLGIDDRPAMIVLTGFLGSGKTSFIEHFVAYQIQRDRFVAVIQNEIGETGLDGKLLGSDNLAVTEIDEGCVCCTLTGQLKPSLQRLCSEFQPDFIILETTGLANPMNFLDDLVALNDLVRIDSVTTMVDALSDPSSQAAPEIVADQIKAADILLLNKVDGLTNRQVDESIARLRRQNPHAAILPTVRGEVNPGILYSPDPRETQLPNDINRVAGSHHSHREDRIESHKVALPHPLDRQRFIRTIEERIPPKIFRIKGIVYLTEEANPMLVQYVSGRYEISQFPDRWEDPGFLICIGQDIAPQFLDDLFGQCFATNRA